MQKENQPARSSFVNLIFKNIELSSKVYIISIIIYIVLSFTGIAISIWLYFDTAQIFQSSLEYHSTSNPCLSSCKVSLTIHAVLQPPIYVMYELGNFYQNHRKYILSKSSKQLAGNIISLDEASNCDPFITNAEMGVSKSWSNSNLNPDDVANPCGAIAYTYFNDTFSIASIDINQTGIAWSGDKGGKFKRSFLSNETQWIDPEDEHFIVWMRTSGLPNFKKVWGRIEKPLSPGEYTIEIQNNSPRISGDRFVILTTAGLMGGKNYLLPTAFVVVGLLCLIATVVFWAKFRAFKAHLQ